MSNLATFREAGRVGSGPNFSTWLRVGSGRVRDPAGRVGSGQKKWFAAHSVLRLHLDTDPFPSLVENHRTVER